MHAGFSSYSYLTIRDVSELLQLNRSTIYAHIKKGAFPKPTKFGGTSRWRFSEIQDFLDNKQPKEIN